MRVLYLVKKEFIEIFRQKELLPLLFIAPIIQVIILGYVVTTDIKNIPVQIVNLSKSRAAVRIIDRIRTTPLFEVRKISARRDGEDHVEALKRGQVKAVILFRDAPTGRGGSRPFPQIQVSMDGVDSNTSAIAAGYFNGIIRQYLEAEIARAGRGPLLESRSLIRFNPSLRSINYMGPGIVALLLTILSLFFTAISIVREKEQQTMDTLLISRLSPMEIYLGKALPMALVGLFNMTMGILVVILWFGIPVRGSLLVLLPAALIFLAAILAYALLISTIAATQQQALFFSWFSIVTFILLSGLFTPVENIPAGIRLIADINPLRYLIGIIREIFLKGNGIAFFYQDLLILAAIAGGIILISLLNFRRFISK
jgi:ABC-2 type transport system permease protein